MSRSSAALLLIFAAALALRLVGIDFGRPFVYHPDEAFVAKPALDMVREGDWDPGLFLYPSALLYAERVLISVIHGLTGAPLDTALTAGVGGLPSSGTQDFLSSQFVYVLAGRVLVAVLGALTVVVVYLAARRVTCTSGALAAAGFLAVSSIHVQHSHYLATDVPTGLATAATLWLALQGRNRGPRWLIAAGLAAGIAASTKYNGGLVVLVPVLVWSAQLIRPREADWRRFVAVAGGIVIASAIGFVALTPAILFNTAAVLETIASQAAVYATGRAGAEGDNLVYYASFFWPPFLALIAAGIVVAAQRRTAGHVAIVAFAVAYFVMISLPVVRYSRNLEPIMPFVAVLAGIAVGALLERTAGSRIPRAAALVSVLVIGGQAARIAVDNDLRLLREDTRTRAGEWIAANIEPGSVIVREDFTPQVPASSYRVGFAGILSNHRIEFYREIGARYLVASSAEFQRFTEPGWERGFYERLLAMPIIHDERPSGTTTGPRIVIVDLQP